MLVAKRDRMKGMPNMHPKGQPLVGSPSAWRPLGTSCTVNIQSTSSSTPCYLFPGISLFSPPSCPRVVLVPPFTCLIISQFLHKPTLPCETHTVLGKLPFPANSASTSSMPGQGTGQMTKKIPLLFRDLPLIQTFLT